MPYPGRNQQPHDCGLNGLQKVLETFSERGDPRRKGTHPSDVKNVSIRQALHSLHEVLIRDVTRSMTSTLTQVNLNRPSGSDIVIHKRNNLFGVDKRVING